MRQVTMVSTTTLLAVPVANAINVVLIVDQPVSYLRLQQQVAHVGVFTFGYCENWPKALIGLNL